MALEDFVKGNPVTAVGIGVATLALPYFFPALRPQAAAMLKSGAKLFLEAEVGADNQVLDSLVDSTIDRLLSVTSKGTEAERRKAGEAEIHRFMRIARSRSRRRGSDLQDQERRYHRHIHRLKERLAQRGAKANPAKRAALDHATDVAFGSEARPARLPSASGHTAAGATRHPKHKGASDRTHSASAGSDQG